MNIGGVGVHADGNAPASSPTTPVVNPSPAYTPGVQSESVVSVSSFVSKVDPPAAGPNFCPSCGASCKGQRFCAGCGFKLQ